MFVALAIVYGGSCLLCLGAVGPRSFAIGDVLWLLGPPATLVLGSEVLWLFAIETVVLCWTLCRFVRATRRCRRRWLGGAALGVWVFSGFFAYAIAW